MLLELMWDVSREVNGVCDLSQMVNFEVVRVSYRINPSISPNIAFCLRNFIYSKNRLGRASVYPYELKEGFSIIVRKNRHDAFGGRALRRQKMVEKDLNKTLQICREIVEVEAAYDFEVGVGFQFRLSRELVVDLSYKIDNKKPELLK